MKHLDEWLLSKSTLGELLKKMDELRPMLYQESKGSAQKDAYDLITTILSILAASKELLIIETGLLFGIVIGLLFR